MTEEEARALATELYRAILKREPDEGGLKTYTDALMADGSPGRVIALMQEFSRSTEAEIVSAKVRGVFVRSRSSPLGPINHVISLGTDCYASFALKLAGWKRASYPFDWILSSPAMIVDVLRDDFARFLDPAYHRRIPIEQRRSPNERCAEHLFYRDRYGVDAVFMHRDITDPAHRAYHCRAVERFRSVMAANETKLLFMTNIAARHATIENFTNLCQIIDARYRNAKLLAVNVERATDDNVALVGGRMECRIGHHELVRYQASSGLNGTTFVNWLDDVHVRGLVAQHEMCLVG